MCVMLSQAISAKEMDVIEYDSPVPRLQDFGLDVAEVAQLVGDKQMILTHPPKTFMAPMPKGKLKEFKDQSFVTSVMVVEAPASKMRKTVLAVAKYKEFVPKQVKSDVIKFEKNKVLTDNKAIIDAPIFKMRFNFINQHTLENNGDVTIIQRKGPVDSMVARWEFIPLSKERSLAVFTSWTDMGSASFLVRRLLSADPDLERAAPLALGAVVVEEFKKRAEGYPMRPAKEEMPEAPTTPMFAKGQDVSIDTLVKLSEIGTLLFVHKAQWIHNDEGELEFIYVTAGKIVEAPVEDVINTSIKFDRYDEFFHHVHENEIIVHGDNQRTDSFDVDWLLKVGVGILKLKIEYLLGYDWIDPYTLKLTQKSGDVRYMDGVWEYVPISENRTLVVATQASKVGENGAFILRFANKLPNMEMMGAIIAQTMIVEKQAPWIEAELAAKNGTVAAAED